MSISLHEIGFSYGGREVLKNVSCTFDQGVVTGLIGPNGTGKTTLLKLASGELKPGQGAILLDSKPVRSMSAKARARRIATVPQRAKLSFDFSVMDMVLMGRQPHLRRFEREGAKDNEIAMQAIERMGIAHLKDRNARALSGGEWQRVLIARALCQQTDVILLDEPVSNLDIRHQMEVLSTIRELAHERKAAAVVVLHDLNLAAHYCDKLILLSEGDIAAQGSAGAVITPTLMKSVYGIDASVEPDGDSVLLRPSYL